MILILIHDHSFGGFETTFEQLKKKNGGQEQFCPPLFVIEKLPPSGFIPDFIIKNVKKLY